MEEQRAPEPSAPEYDAIVIGAGVAGLYQLYRLQERGLKVLCLEAGSDVGGVWYWNCYPGARLDSEAYSYAYSFSEELLEEWNWSEHFAAQPELHRYFTHVARKFDLYRLIRFDSRVASLHYQPDSETWQVGVQEGPVFQAKLVVTALGPLTTPTYPNIPGVSDFRGESYHTSRWPREPVSLEGKRVAVIGTGSTGVQVIQEAAKVAGQLYVMQRTPVYCAPLNNEKIADDEQRPLKDSYPDVIAKCRASSGWFMYDADPRSVFDVSEAEREAFLEDLYQQKGISIQKANFRDVAVDEAANEIVSEFMRRKIRERVKDPAVAAKLVPYGFGFGTRRIPLETKYYEAFNQHNVRLIDLRETPIERIEAHSIRTSAENIEVDVLVYATGFDAITGSYDRIDIRGLDGVKLKDKWANGPETFLGVHCSGFPNLFMAGGPLASIGNFTPALEYSVNWIMDIIDFMTRRGYGYIDVSREAELEWTNSIRARQEQLLIGKVKSWMTGVNTNIEGRDVPRAIVYVGSAQDYRARCDEVRASEYQDFSFHSDREEASSVAAE